MRTHIGNLAERAYTRHVRIAPMQTPLSAKQARRRHLVRLLREGLVGLGGLAVFALLLALAVISGGKP